MSIKIKEACPLQLRYGKSVCGPDQTCGLKPKCNYLHIQEREKSVFEKFMPCHNLFSCMEEGCKRFHPNGRFYDQRHLLIFLQPVVIPLYFAPAYPSAPLIPAHLPVLRQRSERWAQGADQATISAISEAIAQDEAQCNSSF